MGLSCLCCPVKKILRIMRLTVFMILLSFVQLLANSSYAQKTKISVDYKNTSIEMVLLDIENQSNFKFIYNKEKVDVDANVSIQLKDKLINETLDALFEGKNISYSFYGNQVILKNPSLEINQSQQQKSVSGKVTDSSGATLPGVSVVVKGTTSGTITDMDGKYSLGNVPANATLQFSFVGMKTQEIAVGGKSMIDMTLTEESIGLDEVVAIGYGNQKKKDITGSVGSISNQDIIDRSVSDVGQALAGRIPGLDVVSSGVNPGDVGTILLRGRRSFVASNDPLVILDGMTFYGSLNDINPYDIKSIDVLKDASSTSIYGSRGANGVIIITTKRGQIGKPKFILESYAGFQKNYGEIPMMNSEQYVQWQREAARAAGSTAADDVIDHQYLGDLLYNNYKAGKSVDWQDMLYKTGFQQKHQLTVSGGSEAVQYNVTANMFTEEGTLLTREFERYTVQPSLDIKLTPNLKTGITTLLSYNLRHQKVKVDYALEDALFNSPLGSPTEEDGTPRFDPANNGYRRHPLSDLIWDSYRWEDKRYSAYLSMYAEWKIIPALTYRINLNVDANFNPIKESAGAYSIKGSREGKPTSAYVTNSESFRKSYENILTFDKIFNNIHHLTFTGIQSFQSSHSETNYIGVQGLPYLPSRWYNIGTASTINGYTSDLNEWKLLSFAGRAFYGLYDKYLLTLTLRADGATQFAPKHKWGYFPSAAFAWRISEEKYLKEVQWLSNLKLRISYGIAGNQAITPYQTQGNLSSTIYGFDETDGLGLRPGALANQDLKWESTAVYNMGVDFGFFDSRINGNVELYKSNTTDLLMYRQLPISSGFSQVLSNVGSTQNKGIEFALHTLNIKKI